MNPQQIQVELGSSRSQQNTLRPVDLSPDKAETKSGSESIRQSAQDRPHMFLLSRMGGAVTKMDKFAHVHAIKLQSGQDLKYKTFLGGTVSAALTVIGAIYLGKEFMRLGVAGVKTTETLIAPTKETLDDVFYLGSQLAGPITSSLDIYKVKRGGKVLTEGVTAYLLEDYDNDSISWVDPNLLKHLRLKLLSGPPVPFGQYSWGPDVAMVPVKSVDAMECPEDHASIETMYQACYPSVCFDTSKIDPISSRYLPGDEGYVSTNWFFVIEECRDKPECASTEEIAKFLESHMVWSGEYAKFLDAQNQDAMSSFLNGEQESSVTRDKPFAVQEFTLKQGTTKRKSLSLRKKKVVTDHGWFLSGLQKKWDTFYSVYENQGLSGVEFDDKVLYVKQHAKDVDFEIQTTIKFRAVDQIFGFVGGLFGFISMFIGSILLPYAQVWFNIDNSSLKEHNRLISEHAAQGEQCNQTEEEFKEADKTKKRLSSCCSFFSIYLGSVGPSWIVCCKSVRETFDIYNEQVKEIESVSNVSGLHMRLDIANQKNQEAEKNLEDIQAFAKGLDLKNQEEFEQYLQHFQKFKSVLKDKSF